MSTHPLADWLRARTGVTVEELAGAALAGEMPIPAATLNRLLAHRLSAGTGRVAGIRLTPLDGQRLTADLTLRDVPFVSSVTVAAEIVEQPEWPARPLLRVRWDLPGLGPLARLAVPALSSLVALPPWLRLDGDLAIVDLAALLADRGLGELAGLLTRLEVETRAGALLVRYAARIPLMASESAASR